MITNTTSFVHLNEDNTFFNNLDGFITRTNAEAARVYIEKFIDQDNFKTIQAYCFEKKVDILEFLLSIFSLIIYKYTQSHSFFVDCLIDIESSDPVRNKKEQALLGIKILINENDKFIDVLDLIKKERFKKKDFVDKNNCYQKETLPRLCFIYQSSFELNSAELLSTKENFPSFENTYDFYLSFNKDSNVLNLHYQYSKGLFFNELGSIFPSVFNVVIDQVLKKDSLNVAKLKMLSATDEQSIIKSNESLKVLESPENLVKVFKYQSTKNANKIAVEHNNNVLTYENLNNCSDKIAAYFYKNVLKKDQSEKYIAICCERSVYLPAAILGVLKLGAAYIPLDPNCPEDRIEYILKDASVSHVLTDIKNFEKFSKLSLNVHVLDSILKAKTHHKYDEPKILSSSPAYIIYTSGSTGRPKGVVVSHKNISRLFSATENFFSFSSSDVWCLFHSYAFDFSVWEIWGAFFYGGKLIIVDYEICRSVKHFREILKNKKITVLNQTPSAFKQLLNDIQIYNNYDLPYLKWIIFGGEALEPRSIKPWFSLHPFPKAKLINMYGITETTVHVTKQLVDESYFLSEKSKIGKPLEDLKLYLLDKFMNILPVGFIGELYIGGAGVSSGYINQEKLTNERFIPNPFNLNEKDKLYKTGDLARILLNGSLEYLGRADSQVQIRGYRVELEEIEKVLIDELVLSDCKVRVEIEDDLQTLEAYLVGCTKNSIQIIEILKKKLVNYMIPNKFYLVSHIPFNINGKIDIKKLIEIRTDIEDTSFLQNQKNSHSALTGIMKIVYDCWCKALKRDSVPLDKSFIEIGGHSLLIFQLLSEIQKKLSVNNISHKLSVLDFFENQTVYSLSQFIEKQQKDY